MSAYAYFEDLIASPKYLKTIKNKFNLVGCALSSAQGFTKSDNTEINLAVPIEVVWGLGTFASSIRLFSMRINFGA